ncbi:hypothetical protein VC83_05980 [Pseudogymnoascus destructans]|uniref:Uncharacterized protein n=1 Tax=Pseudogymnoascus destructans TaxID=655981 RepID=A0A177A497_9PEZI|nr:uncharacterized protein VC83_05980 [Pseudogymnoascus destructans]OAF56998.1 hypothetical protein VC83_05980 [Pseudogymnoascus destructans]
MEVSHLPLILPFTNTHSNSKSLPHHESILVDSIAANEEGKGVRRGQRRPVRARASTTQQNSLSRRHLTGLTTSFSGSRGGEEGRGDKGKKQRRGEGGLETQLIAMKAFLSMSYRRRAGSYIYFHSNQRHSSSRTLTVISSCETTHWISYTD